MDRRPRVYQPKPFAAVYGALLVAGTVMAFGLYFVLLHVMHGAAAPLSTRLDVAKTALLVVGGSGAVAGLYVAYRKQRTDEANHLRDQDKLFTERYTAAASQLGNTASAAIRLAGVYALARIADDSERDRPTCLKVLCAYLRMPYDPDDRATEPAERQVRTTAQTVIAERLRPDHPGFWPDARIDLTDAHLIGLDFSGIIVGEFAADHARFGGDAVFSRATFGNAWFRGAAFSRDAGFDEAMFNGDAWFGGTTFNRDAGFRRAIFNRYAGFNETTFKANAGFGEAMFKVNAGFSQAKFNGDAGFGGTTFNGDAGFSGTTFNGNGWFRRAIFNRHAGFSGTTFKGDAGFGGTTFNGVVEFNEATFNRVVGLNEATFNEATFNGHAWFGKATFNGIVEFGEARFDGVAGFGEARFRRDHPPVWPEGFAEPAGIVWVDPPTADPGPDPNPPPDPPSVP